jgi:hypothetical protein
MVEAEDVNEVGDARQSGFVQPALAFRLDGDEVGIGGVIHQAAGAGSAANAELVFMEPDIP